MTKKCRVRLSKKCEVCEGSGLFGPVEDNCDIPDLKSSFVEIQRCDTCCKFDSDLEAAQYYFEKILITKCKSEGEHILVDKDSIKSEFKKLWNKMLK